MCKTIFMDETDSVVDVYKRQAPDDIGRYFPVAYMQLHQNGRFTESDAPLVFLWDNFAVELLDDSFDAEVIESGDDHVDVRSVSYTHLYAAVGASIYGIWTVFSVF